MIFKRMTSHYVLFTDVPFKRLFKKIPLLSIHFLEKFNPVKSVQNPIDLTWGKRNRTRHATLNFARLSYHAS